MKKNIPAHPQISRPIPKYPRTKPTYPGPSPNLTRHSHPTLVSEAAARTGGGGAELNSGGADRRRRGPEAARTGGGGADRRRRRGGGGADLLPGEFSFSRLLPSGGAEPFPFLASACSTDDA
jgi:hypothetical protein